MKSRTRAKSSRTRTKSSRNRTKSSRSRVKSLRTRAKSSRTRVKSSRTRAKSSRSRVKSSRTRAKSKKIKSIDRYIMSATAEEISNPEESKEEWSPKPDNQYYGEILSDITLDELINIMIDGLYNYVIDARNNGWTVDEIGNAEILSTNVLDRWIEHDSLEDNKFAYLITDDNSDYFFDKVTEGLIERDPYLQ